MTPTWLFALGRLGAMLLLGAMVGLYFEHLFAGLFVAAMISLWFHLFHLIRLERELGLPRAKTVTVPDGTGVWARTLARIDHAHQRLRKSKKAYRSLLKEVRNSTNAMPDGVVSLNNAFEILRYNRAARRNLGLKAKRDRGQRIDNLVRHPEFIAYLNARDSAQTLVLPSPVLEGSFLSMRMVPYGGDDWMLLVRDITEQTQLARMRRDFVANASHELRTPLTVIAGYLDAMAEEPELPEAWLRPVGEMRSQAGRMLAIITDLLKLSRLESDSLLADEQCIDFAEIVRQAADSAPSSLLHPEVELRIETPKAIRGNQSVLESVVSNLFQNALRYTPSEGKVTLLWRSSEDGGAEFSVVDTGEGIAEADIPRLTERFFRADRGRSRHAGGIGLGLAIVKHALNRHDAELHIESRLGQGSTFSCLFPSSRLCDVGDEIDVQSPVETAKSP
ncbi:MAG: phosphate regulon sensor histidine kinase PhoR [Pseudomonadota bacterium]